MFSMSRKSGGNAAGQGRKSDTFLKVSFRVCSVFLMHGNMWHRDRYSRNFSYSTMIKYMLGEFINVTSLLSNSPQLSIALQTPDTIS